MSRIELKTIQHMKNQTISNLNEKRQLADDKTEITWTLDLSDKNEKTEKHTADEGAWQKPTRPNK